jgi:hypothetical protein
MSHATAVLSSPSDQGAGFDRYDRGARAGWLLIWRASEFVTFASGQGNSVWVWDKRDRSWDPVPAEDAALIWREHEFGIKQLARAVPVIGLYLNSPPGPEREAARLALARIGAAIAARWKAGADGNRPAHESGWIDDPAVIYALVTRDCRHHLGVDPTKLRFSPRVFAELAEATVADFRAGRRARPPRVGPGGMAGLQVHAGGQAGEAMRASVGAADNRKDPEAAEGAERPLRDELDGLREALRADLARLDSAGGLRGWWRRLARRED